MAIGCEPHTSAASELKGKRKVKVTKADMLAELAEMDQILWEIIFELERGLHLGQHKACRGCNAKFIAIRGRERLAERRGG